MKANRPASQCRRASVVVAGWCALLLYAGTFSPLGLEIATVAGSLDGTHRVNLHTGTEGTQLVLHHDGNCAIHRHGSVARALVVFARPASKTNPDHVIQFSASDSFLRQAQLTAPAPATYAQLDFALHETPLASPREVFLSSIPTHPPPDDAGQLVCLRSTLLLI